MLPFLVGSYSEGGPLTDRMSLPHQDHEEEEGKYGKEGHHTVHPADRDGCDPIVDIKIDREAKEKTHRVHWDCGFDSMTAEALEYN